MHLLVLLPEDLEHLLDLPQICLSSECNLIARSQPHKEETTRVWATLWSELSRKRVLEDCSQVQDQQSLELCLLTWECLHPMNRYSLPLSTKVQILVWLLVFWFDLLNSYLHWSNFILPEHYPVMPSVGRVFESQFESQFVHHGIQRVMSNKAHHICPWCLFFASYAQ